MSNPSFALKKPPTNNALFMPTNPALNGMGELLSLNTGEAIVFIGKDKLHHYHSHPFKLYEDERRRYMTESIRANGIMVPLIVRPLPNGDYEILAGHNRYECGKEADMTEMPCIIKEGLSDEVAHLIVTESNHISQPPQPLHCGS